MLVSDSQTIDYDKLILFESDFKKESHTYSNNRSDPRSDSPIKH